MERQKKLEKMINELRLTNDRIISKFYAPFTSNTALVSG